jgi:hypothetical protein
LVSDWWRLGVLCHWTTYGTTWGMDDTSWLGLHVDFQTKTYVCNLYQWM